MQHERKPSQRPLREAVRVGNVIVIAHQDEASFHRQKQTFLAKGYGVDETTHFIVCRKLLPSKVVLLHCFTQETIDADLICFIGTELSGLGIIASEKEFGATLFAVLASTFPAPRDQMAIWRHFCQNTLTRLRKQMSHPLDPSPIPSYIGPFAALYRRMMELGIGDRFLDVGCSFGWLPLLIAEYLPNGKVTGCDNNPDALAMCAALAKVVSVPPPTFLLRDVHDPYFVTLGTFDTVTAVHLLEHFTEADTPVVLSHLLQVTGQRLIIAVPYEPVMQPLYGHRQVFTSHTLDVWGKWCVDWLCGDGRYWLEELMGGLLVVERLTQ